MNDGWEVRGNAERNEKEDTVQCMGGAAQSLDVHALKETRMWRRLWGERLDTP